MVFNASLLRNDTEDLRAIADDIARNLSYAKTVGGDVFVQTPISLPTGRAVGIKLLGGPATFTITDDGMVMREAELLGADDICRREARKVAGEFGIKFNEWELFELEAPTDRLVGLTALVANAAATTMMRTSDKFAERFELRRREDLSVRLSRIFGEKHVSKDVPFVGAARSWQFDAQVYLPNGRTGLFSLVTPASISIAVAYSKFDDVSRVERPPFIGAVLDGVFDPGDKALLGRAARRIFAVTDPDDAFRLAA